MTFLAPALLAGLLAVAVPIIVHLVQRERRRVVAVPSLMFLRKIPYQATRRRAIRHWPLLLLRVLAFALIALAFARPFLPGSELRAGASGGDRQVMIVLDRSASMAYGDHWNRARAAALSAVQSLNAGDRAGLAFFGTDVEVAVRPTTDRGAVLSALEAAAPGAGGTRFLPALRGAAGQLEGEAGVAREIVLISDFQKHGWDRGLDLKLAAGITLTPVSVAEPDAANAAIVGLTFQRELAGGREQVAVSARVANRSGTRIADREIVLEVDGHRVESRRISVEPHAPGVATFAAFPLAGTSAGAARDVAGPRSRITVRLAPDRLPADDVFHAVIASARRVPLVVLDGSDQASNAALYLVRALDVAAAPGFETRVLRVERAASADINAAAVVVLNNAAPSGQLAAALEAAVRAGTGVFVALGERSTWPAGAPDLLPGPIGAVVDRAGTSGGMLGFVDYAHPAFEVFSAPRTGDLTAARFFRYRSIDARDRVLARFDDGAVALAERRIGRGSVLAWASTLDSYWNDFALKPVFVPFVHRAMTYLAHYQDEPPWQTVGTMLDLAAVNRLGAMAGASRDAQLVAVTPGGRREQLERGDRPGGVLSLAEQGFYELQPAVGRTSHPALVAVNQEAAESDLTPLDPAELAAAAMGGAATSAASAPPEPTTEERERRQALWWYLLAGGLGLLVVEGAVANRLR